MFYSSKNHKEATSCGIKTNSIITLTKVSKIDNKIKSYYKDFS